MRAGKCDLCFHYRTLGIYQDDIGRTLEICRDCFNKLVVNPALDRVTTEYTSRPRLSRKAHFAIWCFLFLLMVVYVVEVCRLALR